jgi:hypothetical protein
MSGLQKFIQQRQVGADIYGKPVMGDVFPLVNDPMTFSLNALNGLEFGFEIGNPKNLEDAKSVPNTLSDARFIACLFYTDDPTVYTVCLVTRKDVGEYLRLDDQKEDNRHIAFLCQVETEKLNKYSWNYMGELCDIIKRNDNTFITDVFYNDRVVLVGDERQYGWGQIQSCFKREYKTLQRSNILVSNIPVKVNIPIKANVPKSLIQSLPWMKNSEVVLSWKLNTPAPPIPPQVRYVKPNVPKPSVEFYEPGPSVKPNVPVKANTPVKVNAPIKVNTPKPLFHKVLPGKYTHTKVGNSWQTTHTPSKGGRRKRTKRSKRSTRRYTKKQ